MTFNASKWKVLSVSRKLSPVGFEYHLKDETSTNVRKEKDLGVLITSHLTWDQQVLAVVYKANKILGFQRRTRLLIHDTRVRQSLHVSFIG
jgi:hypothetical protein